MSTNAVELRSIRKSFGRHCVLKGVDLDVPSGSVFAFLGNNGQGKSTTIRVLLGLMRADAGSARVLGCDVTRERRDVLARVGCLVEAPSAYPNLRGIEFLDIARRLKRLCRGEIDRVLEAVGLAQSGSRAIAQYSLGMKQRLALAHALMGRPQLLVLDEPTNGLDPEGMHEIRALIRGLPAAAGCTVFYSSHQLDEVEKTASHVALLRDGRVQLQTSLDALRDASGIRVTVDDPVRARQALGQRGFAGEVLDAETVLVHAVGREQAPAVNACVVDAGVALYASQSRRPTLEHWFLQAVGVAT